ncbi:MAG TPA: DUF3187 family protein, partial [Geobacteraceae bacterium]
MAILSELLPRGGKGSPENTDRSSSAGRGGAVRICGFAPFAAFLLSVLMLGPTTAFGVEITPFYTQNQSPVIQIFGLPAAGDAKVVGKGRFGVILAADLANNYAVDETIRENITLDGENYRFTLGLRYGLSDRFEAGIDIPYVGQGGGFLDNFIIGWHRFFGLPQGGRTEAPKNRLLYNYSRDGQNRLLVDNSSFSIGDIRLHGAMQLYNDGKENPFAVALRASVKVPTGNSHKLHGSGSTDGALWLTASDDYKLPAWLGHFTLFGAVGGMGMTSGDILRDQQRNVAGFFTFGFGWGPAR